jgi:hypothetical protein
MCLRRLLTSLVTAASLTVFASGQVRGVGGFAHPPSVTPGFASFGPSASPGFNSSFPRHSFANAPVIFFSDVGYEPAGNQPISVIVVQPPSPAVAPREEEPRPPAKPLLLELHGDHFVPVDQFQVAESPVSKHDSKAHEAKPMVTAETLLVFRDGHAESTSAYALIGDALYEQSNYWTSGSWTRKIAIADLDLQATIKANQQRGVVFKLPGGPHEVVLQP